MPKNDVEWVITPSGQLKISWLKKIAKYEEGNKVMLSLTDLSQNNSVKNVTGTAKEVTTGNLQIGAEYLLHLEDLIDGDRFGPIRIEACKINNLL